MAAGREDPRPLERQPCLGRIATPQQEGPPAVKEGDITQLAADRYPATTGNLVDFGQV